MREFLCGLLTFHEVIIFSFPVMATTFDESRKLWRGVEADQVNVEDGVGYNSMRAKQRCCSG